MNVFFDWILIIISTLITYYVYKQVVFNRSCSISHYVILVIYFFCCVPIFLNYAMGLPQYKALYWYRVFSSSMKNPTVSVIYDLYILSSIIVLYFYGRKRDIILQEQFQEFDNEVDNKILHYFIVFSPVIYAVVSGNFSKLFSYTAMSVRGIDSQESFILNSFILLSIYDLCILVFSGELSGKKVVFLLFMSILLAWIQGKRFIIAVMAIFYLFFLSKSDLSPKTRKRLQMILPIAGILLVAFSAIYFIVIKPLSTMGIETVYDMLRVDFGRDDVIKYVIEAEFIKGKHILDYPGQSFFSTLLVFIPRFIWKSKPYSHYQYLTSSILGVSINKLPAGTTPCWYEMCLCNFGVFGFAVGIIGLVVLCRFADSMKQMRSKSLVFMLILVLLTQNTDVYIVYILLMFVFFFLEHI